MISRSFLILSIAVFFFFKASNGAVKGGIKDETEEEAYLNFQNKILNNAMKVKSSPHLQQQMEERVKMVQQVESQMMDIEYRCDPSTFKPSPTVPNSVHELRPADIKVVAAFGDSVTACNGCGARNLVELALERRGEAWTAGNDRNMHEGWITIPNILHEFGGETAGYSTCWSLQYSNNAWFNAAQPGGRNIHMPGQARRLVEMMKEDTRNVDFENDWKLFTLLIGGNDLCGYCTNPTSNSPQNYRDNIEETVDIIKENIPRSVFQIVTMFDVTPLANLSDGILCDILQRGFCECALNKTMIPTIRQVAWDYYLQMEDLVNQEKYKDSDEFTVIHQHQMRDFGPWIDPETGTWDTSFMSVDCFHPNRYGHRLMAYMLWNAMLWPVGQKPTTTTFPVEKLELCCPLEEFPYIFTWKNSQGVPNAPWQPGQTDVCWNPAGASAKTVKKVTFPKHKEETMEEKLARLGPAQKIHPSKRVRRSLPLQSAAPEPVNYVLYSILGIGFVVAVVVGILMARKKA